MNVFFFACYSNIFYLFIDVCMGEDQNTKRYVIMACFFCICGLLRDIYLQVKRLAEILGKEK